MSYFKINDIDFSQYVSGLRVNTQATYTSQTNAAGNTVIDIINSKRVIEVEIIPLNAEAMAALQEAIATFGVSISFRDPKTNTLAEGVACIIPSTEIEYYTIQANKVLYNACSLKFTEL